MRICAGAAQGLSSEVEFSDFFSTRRPKHVFAGAALQLRLTSKLVDVLPFELHIGLVGRIIQ